jgi:hypothetical protein
MEAILKHVNEKLEKHKLKLIDQKVMEEHSKVMECWKEIADSFTKPVKFLIVGEATVSWDNYFYNPDATSTSFLTPAHFGFESKKKKTTKSESKSKLIEFFKENKVLVFDLYPLPLPTFIYDSIKFDCEESNVYVRALKTYYCESLFKNKIIDKNTVIVSRYSKFYKEKTGENGQVVLDEKRFEWEIFMKAIDREINDFKPIYGSYSADADKVRQVFQEILY